MCVKPVGDARVHARPHLTADRLVARPAGRESHGTAVRAVEGHEQARFRGGLADTVVVPDRRTDAHTRAADVHGLASVVGRAGNRDDIEY